ncbi:hypothetical protein FSARC_11719 [Fusarium sarcochroum]|uniref:Uncharacterized protein n=1 Tax=Fusarium sarcochroum TaxID=1208366 RepID=A0A8H4TDR5_9HYPO|nr:hypothetical protein FSARC_11719 [Fusarium sarcochroum]
MSGMEFVGLTAATIELLKVINKTREALKEFKEAASKHRIFSEDLTSIFNVVDLTSDVPKRLAENPHSKQLDEAQKQLRIIDGYNPAQSLADRVRLMRRKGDLQAVQAKLGRTGVFLCVILMNLLVDGVLNSTADTLLKEVLGKRTMADIKESLKEAVQTARQEVEASNQERQPRTVSALGEKLGDTQTSRPSSIREAASTPYVDDKKYRVLNNSRPVSSQSLDETSLNDKVVTEPPVFLGKTPVLDVEAQPSSDPSDDKSPEERTEEPLHEIKQAETLSVDSIMLQSDLEDPTRIHATEHDIQGDTDRLSTDSSLIMGSDVPECSNKLPDSFTKTPIQTYQSRNYACSGNHGLLDSPMLVDILAAKELGSHAENGTWIGATILEEGRYGVLVFQRPDNWIQLAILPKSLREEAQLGSPLVKAMQNTPLHCHFKQSTSDCLDLRLYFFTGDKQKLSTCEITLHPPFNLTWKVSILQTQGVVDLPPPMLEMGFFHGTHDSFISYATVKKTLVFLTETASDHWVIHSHAKRFTIEPGDQVTRRFSSERTLYTTRIYRHKLCFVTELVYPRDVGEYDQTTDESLETSEKPISWGDLMIDQTSISFLPLQGKDGYIEGFICKTVEDDLYILEGHPWYKDQGEPVHVCKVMPGSKISVSDEFSTFSYTSTEGELSRIKFEVSKVGKINLSESFPVFPRCMTSRRIEDVSFPTMLTETGVP